MMQRVRRFFSIVALGLVILMPATLRAATTNIPMGDVGDNGTWMTDHNVAEFNGNLTRDLDAFQSSFQNQLVSDFVPIEARLGMAFMNALTGIGRILDNSLLRFVEIFLGVAYIFWLMFEAYGMMTGKLNARETVENILKKGLLISVWIMILHFGPARIFMFVMGPVLAVGTAMSDMILNAVAQSAGASIPDTCAAIRDYAATNAASDLIISSEGAANIMCIPTRLSGFFYTGVAAGLKWMLAGIGHSAFTFIIGLGFVILFVYNIWKFALVAFGVIADLFLAVFMLPFTAITETLGKTTYKGVAGNIFNGFLDLFKTESLQTQIIRFINAAMYFVSLSIVVGLCAAILSTFVTSDLAANVPTIDNVGFITTLLGGLLVAYLAHRSDEIVSNLGGKIDTEMTKRVTGDINTLRKTIVKQYKQWRAAAKKSTT